MNEQRESQWEGIGADGDFWQGAIRVVWDEALAITDDQADAIFQEENLAAVHTAADALAEEVGAVVAVVLPGGDHDDPTARLLILGFKPKPPDAS